MDEDVFYKKMVNADAEFTRTSEEDRMSKLRKMFRGKKGSEYDDVMTRLKITEEMLFDWTKNPSRLIKGLHILLTTMKDAKRAAAGQIKVASSKHDRVKVINRKSAELMARLQASEDHKTLAFMRIVKWIEQRNKQVSCLKIEFIVHRVSSFLMHYRAQPKSNKRRLNHCRQHWNCQKMGLRTGMSLFSSRVTMLAWPVF